MDKARNTRPVTLPILKLRLPLAGWVSLLHRVSGVLLFLALPVLLCALELSLRSPEDFAAMQNWFAHPAMKLVMVGLVWALAHHLFAGIRHLFMDMHWGVALRVARFSAALVTGLSFLLAAVTAWRLFA